MNTKAVFDANEREALIHLVAHLRSDEGFTVNNETDTPAMRSALEEIINFDTALEESTIKMLGTITTVLILKTHNPMLYMRPLPEQRAAADDIERKLLSSDNPAPVFTDDERLYLNGVLSSLYLMDLHLKVITSDAREPIISGLRKLADLFHEDEPTATENFLRTLAGMVEYGIEGYVNEDTREELLWPAIHKLSKA